jgi:hypothetical protein
MDYFLVAHFVDCLSSFAMVSYEFLPTANRLTRLVRIMNHTKLDLIYPLMQSNHACYDHILS